MANEERKDFNAMLREDKGMPRMQIVTDEATIKKYGGERMYFAPPMAYDEIMRRVPYGKVVTVGKIREYLARENGGDFTEPITAGVFVSIAAWASYQRTTSGAYEGNGKGPAQVYMDAETPWWRTLKADGELNPKYPGGAKLQREKLEAEGHTVIQKGRKNIRYYVKDYEKVLFEL